MELKITEADEKILGTDYPKSKVDRSEAELYPLLQRGSARLINDLYRTEDEQDKYIDEGLAVRLPGRRGFLDKLPRTLRYLRSLFARVR